MTVHGGATLREQRDGLGTERPLTSGRRWGRPVWWLGEARLEVLVALVQGQVILLQVLGLLLLVLLEALVLVKVFVVEVQEVFLFSLSSTPTTTPTLSTRPAARCLGLGR